MKKTAQPIASRQECDREDEGNLVAATKRNPFAFAADWEEIRLIQRARQGDLEAFNCLVLACQDLIFQQVYWMLGKPEAAEDIAQKTFLLAYQELNSLQNGDFCGWLLKIASRLCLEELRRREHNHTSSGETWSIDREEANDGSLIHLLTGLPEGNPCEEDLAKLLQEGMDELSPDLRSVVTLVDIQEMDYDQTAEILCIPPETVKSRLARARVQIRDRLLPITDDCPNKLRDLGRRGP